MEGELRGCGGTGTFGFRIFTNGVLPLALIVQ
jgi:hypothetical protein